MALLTINMQWTALKSKQRMCTEFTTDSRAYFFLMKNISCLNSLFDLKFSVPVEIRFQDII